MPIDAGLDLEPLCQYFPIVNLIFRRVLLLAAITVLAACSGPDNNNRVLILGLDGMDPEAVDLLMSEGQLPNFARLRQDGAYGRFLSQKPLLSPVIWTTIATGHTPDRHGIGHFVAVDSGTGEELPATSDMRRTQALWNIVSAADQSVAVVGWWATWPPEEVKGQIVSDHTAYHFLFDEGFTGGPGAESKTYPAELLESIRPSLRRPESLSIDELREFVEVSESEMTRDLDFADDLGHFRWALATTKSYSQIGLDLWNREHPRLGMVYIEGTDSTAHLFGHLFRAEDLAGELAEQQKRFGNAVESMYRYADRILGGYLAVLDEQTTLIVLSDHGFLLGELHDDPSRTRDMRRVSERFHREEGILYLYGNQVRPHARLERPTLVDIAPTVLALLGIPIGDDMPGRVLGEGLDLMHRPTKIASHEMGKARAADTGDRDRETDKAVLERLEALGYLGGRESPKGDRNLAAIHFEAGRYEEAAKIYQRLVEDEPDNASLQTSLAGTLGAMGRYDEAKAHLDAALEADPLNVEAYHNRAVVYERMNDPESAVADYRAALRYGPSYEPSRRALIRLTGSATTGGPRSEVEARAAELSQQAGDAARRGNYPKAQELLAQAESMAPDLAMVYQYKSNVAYLMGDRAGAIAALERGLDLEPDNALFQENLKRLREQEIDP